MNRGKLYFWTTCALMTAIMCILGPVTLPIGPIPVSLMLLVIFLSVIILGTKGAVVSTVLYLLIGMAGLPVVSGYSGGIAKIAGPTGGYLVGYIFAALIAGIISEKAKGKTAFIIFGMVLGTAAAYSFGTVWFIILMKVDLWYALTVCVFPFIPFDVAKMLIATYLGRAVKNALMKSGHYDFEV